MTKPPKTSSCQTICWSLSVLFGILIAVVASGPLPVLLAVLLGVGLTMACGVLMQRLICGSSPNDWGPFEGLKGVPGWDDGDADEHLKAPTPTTKRSGATAKAKAADAKGASTTDADKSAKVKASREQSASA